MENKIKILCPLCNNASSKDLGKSIETFHFCDKKFSHPINSGRLLNCSYCGLSYRFPLPKESFLLEMYSNTKSTVSWAMDTNNREDYKIIAHKINSINCKNILEIGCFNGSLFHYINKIYKPNNEYKWYGIEPSLEASQIASKLGIEIVGKSITEKGSQKNVKFYDLIIAIDVFEHLVNLQEFLEVVYKLLKPGGHLILSTGTTDNLSEKFLPYWNYACMPEHITFLNYKTTKYISKKYRFKLKSFDTYKNLKNLSIFSLFKLIFRSCTSIFLNLISWKILNIKFKIIRSLGWAPLFKKDHCVVTFEKRN